MRITVDIEPLIKNQGDIMLAGAYEYKGKMRILKEDGTMGIFDVYPSKDKPNPPCANWLFNKTFKRLRYVYENEEKKQTLQDKQTEEIVHSFWGHHPLLLVDGKKHDGTPAGCTPDFNISNLAIAKEKEYSDHVKILGVVNMIHEMSFDQKQDVSYYYGHIPSSLTEMELTLTLADFNKGIVVQKENIDEFKKIWTRDDVDRDMTIVIRKAIEKKIIATKAADGRVEYFLQDKFLGTAINDIINECKREPALYDNHIAREVSKVKIKEPDVKKQEEVLEASEAKAELKDERDELYAEAQQLKEEGFLESMQGWKNMGLEKMKPLVAAARKLKQKSLEPA